MMKEYWNRYYILECFRVLEVKNEKAEENFHDLGPYLKDWTRKQKYKGCSTSDMWLQRKIDKQRKEKKIFIFLFYLYLKLLLI